MKVADQDSKDDWEYVPIEAQHCRALSSYGKE